MRTGDLGFLRRWWYPVARVDDGAPPEVVQLFGEPWRVSLDGSGCPLQQRYGLWWTCVGDPATPEPPTWPEAEQSERPWRVYVEFFEVWRASALRIIDNNLDASHVAYVHRNTFGDPQDAAMVRPVVAWCDHGGFRSELRSWHPGVGVQLGTTRDEDERVERVTETELLAPLTTRIRLRYFGEGPDYSFLGVATPVADDRSIYVRVTALEGPEVEQPWRTFHAFGRRVTDEDRRILEATDPDFPLDVTSEVHLRCDAPTLAYRRYLARQQNEESPCSSAM